MSVPGPSYYKGEDGGLDAADIAGIVVGITLGIPLVLAVCWGFLICYRRKIRPATTDRPRPESNKQVAERIKRDFGTGEEGTPVEGEEHKEVAIEMVEPTVLTTTTTTTTTASSSPAMTPPTGLSPLQATESTTPETTPDSAHGQEAITRM